MDAILQLPKGFQKLETQVAGHIFQANTEELGLLQDRESACVLKPFGKPACGEREIGFYKTLSSSDDKVLSQARELVPRFYDLVKVVVNKRERSFLKLEDLTYGMKKPCVMDIKVGQRTYDPLATSEKRMAEEQKYVQSKKAFGLCVPGFQVFPVMGGAVIRHGKEYGKQLDSAGFTQTIALFLNTEPVVCRVFVREILQQLYAIKTWFNMQRLFHFYASSLLIAYDLEPLKKHLSKYLLNGKCMNGVAQSLQETPYVKSDDIKYEHYGNEESTNEPLPANPALWVKVRMIDFAHVFPAEDASPDTNYMFGLQNLINVVEQILVR